VPPVRIVVGAHGDDLHDLRWRAGGVRARFGGSRGPAGPAGGGPGGVRPPARGGPPAGGAGRHRWGRLLLWALWVPAGLALVRAAGGVVVAAPGLALLLGAGLLWVATLVDARRLTIGDPRELLTSRPLSWLVAAVVGLVVLLALVGTVAGR
jgi:hypothetical protein